MGKPSARTVALRDQILNALRAEWPRPLSTRDVCGLLGSHRYDETGVRIYPQLRALDRRGIIERVAMGNESPEVFWRCSADPRDAELNAAVEAAQRPDIEAILSTLDSYIKALDIAEKRLSTAAASGDDDAEAAAADELAALVRKFVDHCTNWE